MIGDRSGDRLIEKMVFRLVPIEICRYWEDVIDPLYVVRCFSLQVVTHICRCLPFMIPVSGMQLYENILHDVFIIGKITYLLCNRHTVVSVSFLL